MINNKTCENCIYKDIKKTKLPNGHEEIYACCRRKSPEAMSFKYDANNSANEVVVGIFAPIDPKVDWCGEFEEKHNDKPNNI